MHVMKENFAIEETKIRERETKITSGHGSQCIVTHKCGSVVVKSVNIIFANCSQTGEW